MRLAQGDVELVLAPDIGGSIAAFRWRGIDIMRAATAEAIAARDPRDLAAFPLVPFSNRVAHGRFRWAGRDIQLPRNFGDRPYAIHGHGWQVPWQVAAEAPGSAHLLFDHTGGDWPWAYRATQDFALTADGFDYRLAVTNRDASAMPAGLGFHPYFPKPAETQLSAALTGWWRNDAFVMPLGHVAETRTDWSHRLHGPGTTDHVFDGLHGAVTLDWPTHRLNMTASDNARWLIVYAPDQGDIVAVEPVTHPTDAFNTPGYPGIVNLAPGATLALTVACRVQLPR